MLYFYKTIALTTRPNSSNFLGVSGDGERDRMNTIAPQAPYIVSGIAAPSSSPAANWYANLGTTSTNNSNNIGLQYNSGSPSLKDNLNIDKLILNKHYFLF